MHKLDDVVDISSVAGLVCKTVLRRYELWPEVLATLATAPSGRLDTETGGRTQGSCQLSL